MRIRKIISYIILVVCVYSLTNIVYPIEKTMADPYPSIGAIRCLADGTSITLSGKKISAIFQSSWVIYIQEPSISFNGMRVMPVSDFSSLQLGDIVDITGTLKTVSANNYRVERVIKSAVVTFVSHGTPPSPKGMNDNAVGGGAFCAQNSPGKIIAVKDFGANAIGLNNIGLLVKITGQVSYANPSSDIFYVKNSSLLNYPVDPQRYGIMVQYSQNVGSDFAVGDTVSVTGIVESHFIVSWTASNRFIHARTISDVVRY